MTESPPTNTLPEPSQRCNFLTVDPTTANPEVNTAFADGPLTALIEQDLTLLDHNQLDAFLATIKQLHAGGAALESAINEEVAMDKAKKTRTPRKPKVTLLL